MIDVVITVAIPATETEPMHTKVLRLEFETPGAFDSWYNMVAGMDEVAHFETMVGLKELDNEALEDADPMRTKVMEDGGIPIATESHRQAYERFYELATKFGDRPECSHRECNAQGELAFGFTEEQIAVVTDCMVEQGWLVKTEDGKNKFSPEYQEYCDLKQELFENFR